jgi:hypothetical protein
MIDYRDIRVFLREFRYCGTEYRVTVYAYADGYGIGKLEIDGLPDIRPKSQAKYKDLEEAFAVAKAEVQGVIAT